MSLRTGSGLSAKTDFVYVGAIPPWLPRFQPPNNLKIKKPSPTRNREGENKKELEIETFTELTIGRHILAALISQITQSSKANPHDLFVKWV